jgi:hypothetical protein
MERSSASVGSGIFRCRSGCPPGGRGDSILNGFPSHGGCDGIRFSGIFSGQPSSASRNGGVLHRYSAVICGG